MMVVGVWTSAAFAATTINPANAPTGTHLQTGAIGCTVNATTLLVTCSSFELAGVGNTDAEATLVANYTATVDCRNRGGQIVEVKAQVQGAEASTGTIQAKNGRLLVPTLTSQPVPTDEQFEAQAVCPNGNWTKETRSGTIALTSFTYELTFDGFTAPYITVTGP
jgi:hypothetical protein